MSSVAAKANLCLYLLLSMCLLTHWPWGHWVIDEMMPYDDIDPSQHWLRWWHISEVLWHSPEYNFTVSVQATIFSDMLYF